MEKARILVIEDEEDIRELLTYNLQRDGYDVQAVESGEAGLKLIQQSPPALVLLDLMLPGIDGLEVCRRLKADPRTGEIPVVIVSAKGEEADIVSGLELGADDYISKPFSPKIMLARVRAVLRRREALPVARQEAFTVHELSVDPQRFEVRLAGEAVSLTATEFGVLHFLARHPGWVFTRYQIVDAVKGDNYAVTDRAVDVQIVGLRKKMGRFSDYIETVRGVGYRFREV